MKTVTAQKKRLLVDSLLLAFLQFRDGEFDQSAASMQKVADLADVDDVVDEINEDHKNAVDEPADGDTPGADAAGGDDVIDSDEPERDKDLDEDAVQSRLKAVSAAVRAARAKGATARVRKGSVIIHRLHARLRKVRAAKANASPVDRAAAAMANIAKLKGKK